MTTAEQLAKTPGAEMVLADWLDEHGYPKSAEHLRFHAKKWPHHFTMAALESGLCFVTDWCSKGSPELAEEEAGRFKDSWLN